jgi:hypothetical protein
MLVTYWPFFLVWAIEANYFNKRTNELESLHLSASASYFASPNVNTPMDGVAQHKGHVSQHSWIEDSNIGATKCGTQVVTPNTMEVVHMPNKTLISKLVYKNAS